LPLSERVFRVLLGVGGEESGGTCKSARRQVVRGACLVEATPFRRVSRCPNAVAKSRGGNFRTRVWVRRGIPWIYPRDRLGHAGKKREAESRSSGEDRRQSGHEEEIQG
jgi:hypothetical protein